MHTWINLSKDGANLKLATEGSRYFILTGLAESSAEIGLVIEKLGFKNEDGRLVCSDMSLSFNRFQEVFPNAELTGMAPEQYIHDFRPPSKDERLTYEEIEMLGQSKKPGEGRRKPKTT